MPIYQYQCGDCQHQFEALQKISDPKLSDCPECGAVNLRKQVTAAAFKLKGTGWYETDFKNPNKPAQKKGQQDKAPAADSKIKAEAASGPASTSKAAN